MQRLELQTSDVDQPQPLVLRRPPQRARRAVVERHVDPVLADRVPVGVGHGVLSILAVEIGRDAVVERERVPGEPCAGPQRRRDAFEGAATVTPGREVQERAERE